MWQMNTMKSDPEQNRWKKMNGNQHEKKKRKTFPVYTDVIGIIDRFSLLLILWLKNTKFHSVVTDFHVVFTSLFWTRSSMASKNSNGILTTSLHTVAASGNAN